MRKSSPNRRVSLAYSFKYFQEYDEPVVLPPGFEPTRVGVEIRSGKGAGTGSGFRQAFVWKARECPWRPRRTARLWAKVTQMFKQKPNSKAKIDTLIGADTRINGDVEFAGGLHLDGQINGNVNPSRPQPMLSVSEQGCIEGSVMVTSIVLNGVVEGDIEARDGWNWVPKRGFSAVFST